MLVYDLTSCPKDYTRLPRIRRDYDYKLLLGKRVCFDLDGFADTDFWRTRYGENSPQCREASTKLFNYIFYQQILQDQSSSPLQLLINKLWESYGIIENARYDINLRAKSAISTLNSKAQQISPFFQFLNSQNH